MININFDFTTDTPFFWNNYWYNDDLLGCAGNDPDIASKTLKAYHIELWNKLLPNWSENEFKFWKRE